MKIPRATLSFDTLGISMEMSLEPVVDWFQALQERNRRARETEDHGAPLGTLVRLQCPQCRATLVKLTSIERDDTTVRACRGCGCEFGLGQ